MDKKDGMSKTVTVVIPIYNVEKYLNRCIESVVGQTYENLEIILVDDESPDNCPQICEDWKNRDNRIKVVHKKNAGLGYARNTGIDCATGEYICFVDSDDYVAADIAIGISMLGHFFESSGLDFFTSDAISKYMGDSGYTNTGDLSRMNAVSQLYERFLQGNFWESVFGIGLGNASYSAAFSFFNSRFYLLHQALHYQWFTDAIIFIETGTVGLVLYELFFLRVFTYSRKINKRIANEYSGDFSQQLRCVVQVAGITAILCVVNSVYNSALNMDAGYMVYFIFAIPAIVDVFMKGNGCYDK